MLRWLDRDPNQYTINQLLNCLLTYSFHLFLAGLDSGLGDLASTLVSLDNGLDDTDGDGLSHVSDSESAKRWVVGESLNTHGLGWHHLDDGSVTRLDELW